MWRATVLGLGVGMFVVSMVVLASRSPLRLQIVLTHSMMPTLGRGDLVLVRPAALYSPGDIVVIAPGAAGNERVLHRVIRWDTERQVVQTKGDGVDTVDWPVRPSAVEGRVIAWVPGSGAAILALSSPGRVAGFVIVPAVLVVWREAAVLHDLAAGEKRRSMRRYRLHV